MKSKCCQNLFKSLFPAPAGTFTFVPPRNPDAESDLEQFLGMNRELKKSYIDQIRQLRLRQISIKSEIIKTESRLNVMVQNRRLSHSMRKTHVVTVKPGQSLAYFQSPYFFDRKSKSSPYQAYEVQTQSQEGILNLRNPLNEKTERLLPFRPFSAEPALNYKHDALLKRRDVKVTPFVAFPFFG